MDTFHNNSIIMKKLIDIMIDNNLFFDNDFPLSLENNSKELSMLNIKRNPQSSLGNNNGILFN